MPLGPGKYGARAEALLREIDAEVVVVVTIGGRDGGAFDVACRTDATRRLFELPRVLRRVAKDIEREQEAGSARRM